MEPEVVADGVRAMRSACSLPVTVKTRIGVDDRDRYEDLTEFVRTVADGGCDVFVVHARKAWLSGLSPRQNRDVPPLRHDVVRRLKGDFPDLIIVINGGIRTLEETEAFLLPTDGVTLDGVMIGRAAYDDPYVLADADARLFGDEHPVPTRHEALEQYLPYVAGELEAGQRLHQITRHLFGLFSGLPGARAWRRELGSRGVRPGAGVEVVQKAARRVGDGGGMGARNETRPPVSPGKP